VVYGDLQHEDSHLSLLPPLLPYDRQQTHSRDVSGALLCFMVQPMLLANFEGQLFSYSDAYIRFHSPSHLNIALKSMANQPSRPNRHTMYPDRNSISLPWSNSLRARTRSILEKSIAPYILHMKREHTRIALFLSAYIDGLTCVTPYVYRS
jgi:hypothetical protein